jgi:hypothetical protein
MTGLTFSFAFAIQNPGWDFASNPILVDVVP